MCVSFIYEVMRKGDGEGTCRVNDVKHGLVTSNNKQDCVMFGGDACSRGFIPGFSPVFPQVVDVRHSV